MATSGSFYTSGYSDAGWPDKFLFEWSLSKQSVEGNYSVITWALKCSGGANDTRYTYLYKSYVNVNGSEYSSSTGENVYNTTVRHSGTATIYHNADGTKSFSASAKGAFYYSGDYNSTGSGSWSLPTIPRASSISCTTSNIGSNATVSISRASSSFTHTLSYAFGSLTGTIATKTSSTSVNFALPTTFYAQIPNAKSGTGTITCQTYNGSTLIGTKTCSFTATVNESDSKPTLSPSVVDSNSATITLTGDSSKFINYYSNASVSIGASARNSATLKSQKVTCGGKSISSSSGTISAVDSGKFVFSATDSRGYTTSQTLNKTLVNYVKLTCTMNASAATTGGVASLIVSGNYWNGNFGAAANTLTIQYRYKIENGSYGSWTNATSNITKTNNTYKTVISISGLNYLKAYTFQCRAIDKLATVESNAQPTKTKPVFSWGESDFEINGDFTVNGDSIFQGAVMCKTLSVGNVQIDYIVQQGTSGIWTYRLWNSGLAEYWGKEQNFTLETGWHRSPAAPFTVVDEDNAVATVTNWYGNSENPNRAALPNIITCGGIYSDGSISVYDRNYDGTVGTGYRAYYYRVSCRWK